MNNVSIRRQLQDTRKKRRRIRLFLYVFLVILFCAAFLHILFFSGYFNARQISFSGTEVIAEDDARKVMNAVLDEPVFFWSRRRNIFLFSSAEAERALGAYFSRIETVRVSKKFFTKEITVAIAERKPAGTACGKKEDSLCFYFDKNGMLFAPAPAITGAAVLLVKDDNLPSSRALPFAQFTKESILFMQGAKKAAYDVAGASIASFSFLNEYGDIEAITLEGYTVLFTMERDFFPQARIVKNLLALEIKEQVEKLDYIDVRVEGRAYYKLRE